MSFVISLSPNEKRKSGYLCPQTRRERVVIFVPKREEKEWLSLSPNEKRKSGYLCPQTIRGRVVIFVPKREKEEWLCSIIKCPLLRCLHVRI